MKKYVVEFALHGEGSIAAESEEKAHEVILAALEKSASVIGSDLAERSELVHIAARHLHTLRIIREPAEE